jgi:hypothetical protein
VIEHDVLRREEDGDTDSDISLTDIKVTTRIGW